ncbi:MAG: hypothetical protein AB1Z21_07280, partial [Synechococcaceae cyanobacterium]
MAIATSEPVKVETHRDVAAVAAAGAAEPHAVIVVVVIDHEADPHSLQRVEYFPQRAAQYVEER